MVVLVEEPLLHKLGLAMAQSILQAPKLSLLKKTESPGDKRGLGSVLHRPHVQESGNLVFWYAREFCVFFWRLPQLGFSLDHVAVRQELH